MTPSEAEMVVRLMPRYYRGYRGQQAWTYLMVRSSRRSKRMRKYVVLSWTGMRRAPDKVNELLHEIGVKDDELSTTWINPREENVWTLQQRFKPMTLLYMIRNFSRVQRWKVDRLPIVIRYRGKLIVWNGTHRLLIAMLLGRRLRVRVKTIIPGNHSRR